MKDARRPPRGGGRGQGARGGEAKDGARTKSNAARVEALARREGFALEQDAVVTDLLSDAGAASDLPDSLYTLLAEVCTCLYNLEAAEPPGQDGPG